MWSTEFSRESSKYETQMAEKCLKMFNTISHKGNTNEIYFDISSYTSYNGDQLETDSLCL